MRLCNLLWYVCSRGPLRPIFLAALLFHFPSPLDPCTPSAASPLFESHPRLAVACPLGPGYFQSRVTLTVHCVAAESRTQWETGLCCCDRTGNMLDMSRSFATPVNQPLFQTHRPWLGCIARPGLVAVAGGGVGRVVFAD